MEANIGVLRYLSNLIEAFYSFNNRVVFDVKSRSIFVENPKCGSTTIRAAILRTKYGNKIKNEELRSISRNHSSFKSLSLTNQLKFLIQIFRIYNFYTVYFVIREPVSRLESGYRDKILNYSSAESEASKAVFDSYRCQFKSYCRDNNFDISPNAFVNWIVDFDIYNIHFSPQGENRILSLFPKVEYVNLKKLDTLLNSLGLNTDRHKNKRKGGGLSTERIDIEKLPERSQRWLYAQISWFQEKCNE